MKEEEKELDLVIKVLEKEIRSLPSLNEIELEEIALRQALYRIIDYFKRKRANGK